MTGELSRQRPWIVIVGGFLGSGKTSLILAAARLHSTIEEQLSKMEGRKLNVRIECFSPAPPRPERRVPRESV